MRMSGRLTAIALVRIRTSSARGVGSGTFTISRTSGPPGFRSSTILMACSVLHAFRLDQTSRSSRASHDPAVDGKHGARNVGGPVRRQECDRSGYFVRSRPAPICHLVEIALAPFVALVRGHAFLRDAAQIGHPL